MEFKEEIDSFLAKTNGKKKLIVIYGPTASGKTGMSIDIAKYLNTEIISTDSRQIFKYLNIGTGKVTKEEMDGIKHHMLDFLEPNLEYSVGEYKKEAEIIINDLLEKNKIPILCGGTGLYIDSLIYNFQIPKVPGDKNLRQQLEEERINKGNEFVWNKLFEIDPEYAKELHPNNYRYVIRGIEVKQITGKSKKDFKTNKELKYDVLFITPYKNREQLYEKINKRIQIMFDEGLVDEVKDLLKKYKKTDFGMKTIGYKEVIDYLDGKISLDECIDLVKKHNRNYAKRQITWFRRYDNTLE